MKISIKRGERRTLQFASRHAVLDESGQYTRHVYDLGEGNHLTATPYLSNLIDEAFENGSLTEGQYVDIHSVPEGAKVRYELHPYPFNGGTPQQMAVTPPTRTPNATPRGPRATPLAPTGAGAGR